MRAWLKATFAGLIFLFFLRDLWTIGIVGAIFVLSLFQDIHAYTMCWEKHRELTAKFGADYRAVLSEKLAESGFEQLLSGYWAEVGVALKQRLNLEKLP
ncbi:hypothetical protein [Candidatus Viadribacter manganicus]|uniref:hypothetical protein n=1 Tax=Candidatus Viadribacter manganicus TaxID=1759059 RepID=UPI0012EAD950|nr:hypothetical protein [Candidatus Viadribacter manganicus]